MNRSAWSSVVRENLCSPLLTCFEPGFRANRMRIVWVSNASILIEATNLFNEMDHLRRGEGERWRKRFARRGVAESFVFKHRTIGWFCLRCVCFYIPMFPYGRMPGNFLNNFRQVFMVPGFLRQITRSAVRLPTPLRHQSHVAQ